MAHKLKDGTIVFLTSVASGKNLRIKKNGNVDGRGGRGKWARFTVHREGDIVRLQSVGDDSHWLRIHGGLNGKGTGGKFTRFEIVKNRRAPRRIVSFRSIEHAPNCVGILPNGNAKSPPKTRTGRHGQYIVKPFFEAGSNQSKSASEVEEGSTLAFNLPKRDTAKGTVLKLKGMLKEDAEFAEIYLVSDSGTVPYGIVIRTDKDADEKTKGKIWYTNYGGEEPAEIEETELEDEEEQPTAGKKLKLQIKVKSSKFKTKLNGEKLEKYPRPFEFDGLARVIIKGGFEVTDVKIGSDEIDDEPLCLQLREKQRIPQGLGRGNKLSIDEAKLKVKGIPSGKQFVIAWMFKGRCIYHLKVNFETKTVMQRNRDEAGAWVNGETIGEDDFPFELGKKFKMKVKAESDKFVLKVDKELVSEYPLAIPFEGVANIRLVGACIFKALETSQKFEYGD